MRKEYDLSKLEGRKNPYAERLRKEVRIRLEDETVEYFKHLSGETGLPYTSLISLYLRDCAREGRRLRWT